jgi:hypothetical protein
MNCLLHVVLFLLPLFVLATKECKDCVNSGCTFCKNEDLFEESNGFCVCDASRQNFDFFGTLGECSSVKPLNSNLDCAFNTHLSPLIVTAMVVVFLALCYCFKRRRSGSSCCTITMNAHGTTMAATVGGTTTMFATEAIATPVAHTAPLTQESNYPPSHESTYHEGQTDIPFATSELEIPLAGQPL